MTTTTSSSALPSPPHEEQGYQALTRFDFWCPTCKALSLNVPGTIGRPEPPVCPTCEKPMQRYFGAYGENIIINFGERSTHDDITRFQFQNL